MAENGSTRIREIRRVAVAPEEVIDGESGWSYADAFEVWLTVDDDRTAEQWARAALEGAPRLVRSIIGFAQGAVLRLELEPSGAPDSILGWQVAAVEPEVIRLTSNGPLLRGVILGRRLASRGCEIRTFLYFHRGAARPLWLVVGPVHRYVARYLLRRAARAARAGV